MPADLVDLDAVEQLARRWDAVAARFTDAAALWRATTGPPDAVAFAARAAVRVEEHAEVARAAALRLRAYMAAVWAMDAAGARAISPADPG